MQIDRTRAEFTAAGHGQCTALHAAEDRPEKHNGRTHRTHIRIGDLIELRGFTHNADGISLCGSAASEPVQDPFPTAPAGMATIEPEEKLLAKLEKARTYMAVGANGQAQQLLEEVINTSTGEVQRKASEMMALLEKKQ